MLPPRREGGTTVLEGRLALAGRTVPSVTFAFTHPADDHGALPTRPFLLAFLPVAMRSGADLVLEEPVDAITLTNLMEWQAMWADWRPDRLRVVAIRAPCAEAPVVPTVGDRGFVTAFSGGVDSCFTVWRQAQAETASRRTPIGAGLFVRGFDIPPEEEAAGDRAFARARLPGALVRGGRRPVDVHVRLPAPALGLQSDRRSAAGERAPSLRARRRRGRRRRRRTGIRCAPGSPG